MRVRSQLALLALVLLSSSCVAFQRWQKRQTQRTREVELEDVAKSWCQTIRASQVIPVYPLTEDLQPGDVFLVRETVDEQHEEYTRRGFLPFDYHLTRLDPDGYAGFYDRSVLPAAAGNAEVVLPRHWMRPNGELPPPEEAWKSAPRAAFPSYSFSVKSGGGFSLALPVQGVPVGMSLLSSQAASGTINLSDAKTLGVDMVTLWKQLKAWSAGSDAQLLLADYSTRGKRKAYLRIVTRIYLVGAVDVSLASSTSAGGGLDVGAPQEVGQASTEVPAEGEAQASAAERQKSTVETLNKTLWGLQGPGGSLRLTSVGAGTVSLHEVFDTPLVVGYEGFDCEILPGNVLGNPCPTRITLEDPDLAKRLAATDRAVAIEIGAVDTHTVELIRAAVATDELPEELQASGMAILARLDGLASHVDASLVLYDATLTPGLVQATRVARDPEGAGYDDFSVFKSKLLTSEAKVRSALAHPPFRVRADGQVLEVPPGTPERARVEQDLAAIHALAEAQPWRGAEESGLDAARSWLVRLWYGS